VTGKILGFSFVLAAMLLEACGQLFFKQAADRNTAGIRPSVLLKMVWRNRRILAGIACFAPEAILWTLALRYLPVSVAFPAGSMCFVFVALISRIWLHEQVSLRRWIGIALILGGVALIGAR
jgi:undecaprenyl phosphate-alpha-L-ara4N flippase subunit ArnE